MSAIADALCEGDFVTLRAVLSYFNEEQRGRGEAEVIGFQWLCEQEGDGWQPIMRETEEEL